MAQKQELSAEELEVLERFKSSQTLFGHTVVNCRPRKKEIRAKKEMHPTVYWTIWVVSPSDETLLAAMRLEGGRVRLFAQSKLRESYEVKNFKETRP